jgi:hypothetical protein
VNGYTDVPCSHVLDVQPVTGFVRLSSVCLANDAQARKEPNYFLFDGYPPSTRNQTSISAGGVPCLLAEVVRQVISLSNA